VYTSLGVYFGGLPQEPLSVPSALVLFGRQLKKLRESRNLSQERLGELCDFSRHYIGRIERAERVISFEYMMRIAYALAVRPAELYKLIPVPKRMPKKGEYKGEKDGNAKETS
jgi:transcriptional regulator with XRE-family HTH domain